MCTPMLLLYQSYLIKLYAHIMDTNVLHNNDNNNNYADTILLCKINYR